MPRAFSCSHASIPTNFSMREQGTAANAAREAPVRYVVLEVHESRAEKVLRALDERSGRELAVRTSCHTLTSVWTCIRNGTLKAFLLMRGSDQKSQIASCNVAQSLLKEMCR